MKLHVGPVVRSEGDLSETWIFGDERRRDRGHQINFFVAKGASRASRGINEWRLVHQNEKRSSGVNRKCAPPKSFLDD